MGDRPSFNTVPVPTHKRWYTFRGRDARGYILAAIVLYGATSAHLNPTAATIAAIAAAIAYYRLAAPESLALRMVLIFLGSAVLAAVLSALLTSPAATS